ncbi:MAG TPA: DUF2911 domain-containing protein [Vicinamibacteria bacterium]|nr:DUF2911 domain-containing protein [Vicinamibacteria bacterium]
MKTRTFSRIFLAAGLLAVAMPLVLAHGNKPGTATASIGGGEVKVDFVGPAAMGRDVLSLLAPGSYWRMGADKATTLTTAVDLKFGDKVVPKGTYKLVAHLSADKKWSLVVAEDLGSGSAPTKVVGEAPGTIGKTDAPVENMTIKLEGAGNKGKFILDWGNARLTAEFTAA